MADPLPVCYLNGSLLPLREARISPLDRSFLFGDGVYEVIAFHGGYASRIAANLARLRRSLAELQIRNPHSDAHWAELVEALAAANGGGDLYVYLQVSRGCEFGRNHAPLPEVEPTIFGFCSPLPAVSPQALENGVACITADGHALGALRHQVGGVAGQRAAATAGGRGGRGRDDSAARWVAHRRQCLGRSRRRERRDHHPTAQPPIAAGDDPRPHRGSCRPRTDTVPVGAGQ